MININKQPKTSFKTHPKTYNAWTIVTMENITLLHMKKQRRQELDNGIHLKKDPKGGHSNPSYYTLQAKRKGQFSTKIDLFYTN